MSRIILLLFCALLSLNLVPFPFSTDWRIEIASSNSRMQVNNGSDAYLHCQLFTTENDVNSIDVTWSDYLKRNLLYTSDSDSDSEWSRNSRITATVHRGNNWVLTFLRIRNLNLQDDPQVNIFDCVFRVMFKRSMRHRFTVSIKAN